MVTAPKQIGLVAAIADLASGGAIVLPDATKVIEQYRALTVAQTTAGQVITLPAPSDATVIFGLQVSNIGAESFVMYGVTVSASASATFYWDGVRWSPDVAPTAKGFTKMMLTPTALNVVPALATAPQPGTAYKFEVNGIGVPVGITMDAAGAITVDPALVGYNVNVTDVVEVIYYTP